MSGGYGMGEKHLVFGLLILCRCAAGNLPASEPPGPDAALDLSTADAGARDLRSPADAHDSTADRRIVDRLSSATGLWTAPDAFFGEPRCQKTGFDFCE